MYVCVGRGTWGGSEGEVQLYGLWNIQIFLLKLEIHSLRQGYLLIPAAVLFAHMKTKHFRLCDKSCMFPGAQGSRWGPTPRQDQTPGSFVPAVAQESSTGVWLGAGPGCVSHEEGFFQTENSKVSILRFIWNWVWKKLKICMTDF